MNYEAEFKKIYPDAIMLRDNRVDDCWIFDGHGVALYGTTIQFNKEENAWQAAYNELKLKHRLTIGRYNQIKK